MGQIFEASDCDGFEAATDLALDFLEDNGYDSYDDPRAITTITQTNGDVRAGVRQTNVRVYVDYDSEFIASHMANNPMEDL